MRSIEKLEEIKDNFDNPIHEGYWEMGCFMLTTIEIFKSQQAQIADLQAKVKRLEQEGSYFDRVENIKEVRNLNGHIHL